MAAHERYDSDERRLLATATNELWTDGLLDLAVDIAQPVLEAAEWRSPPPGALQRWNERATATMALGVIALRATRTVALTVRSGYAPEAQAGLRRLQEAAGHARQVALDESGQYAENWLNRRGKAGKARIAFGPANKEQDSIWKFMSGQVHAEFEEHVKVSTTVDDEGRLIHTHGPRRDPLWDNICLWLAARTLAGGIAGLLAVRSEIDQGDFLAGAQRIADAEQRLEAEIGEQLVKPE